MTRAAAAAAYPTQRLTLDFGAAVVAVDVVTRLEDYIDRDALLRDGDAPEPPYWLHLWTGSRALARDIAARGGWQGRRVADLGCGLGLAGLVAARLGARVLLVDSIADALRLARDNARLNGDAVDVLQTDLLDAGLRGPFDTLLLADVTYDPRLQEALAALTARLLAPGGVALCAESVRNHDPGFRRACQRLGLRCSEREVRELDDEGRPVPVRLSEVCW